MRRWALFSTLWLVTGGACGGDDGGTGGSTSSSSDTDPGTSGPTSSGPTSSGSATTESSGSGSGTTTSATGSSGGTATDSGTTSGSGSSSGAGTSGSTSGGSGGSTGGVAPECNFDDTCDGNESSSTCPHDCPWGNQPTWCDLVQTGCGFYEQTPGVHHHDVCVEWVIGKYTSNPTNTVEARSYAISIPSDYDGSADTPIYLWLHGSDISSGSKNIEDYTALLDQAGAMASPDDTGAIWVAPLSDDPWNGPEWSFAYQVLETVSCIYNSDPERLYVAGYQAGGSAALRIGYDPQVGVPNIAAIAGWRVGNTIADIGGLFFDPCTAAREVPTFLSASSNADTAALSTSGWYDYLEACYVAGRVTYEPFVGGPVPKWDPAHYGGVEWPWLGAWKLSD